MTKKNILPWLFGGIMTGILFLRYGLSLRFFELLFLFLFLLRISVCDMRKKMIPKAELRILLFGMTVFLFLRAILSEKEIPAAALLFFKTVLQSLIFSLFLLGLVLLTEKIFAKPVLGGGDIKLIFVISLGFPLTENFAGMIFSLFLGVIFGIAGKKKRKNEFPFAPLITVSWFTVLLFSKQINLFFRGMI